MEIKVAENALKGIYAFQITTTTQIHYMYSRSREETYEWLEIITTLQKQAKQRLNRLGERLEPDGTMVLNVIVPTTQVIKITGNAHRLKYPMINLIFLKKIDIYLKSYELCF